MKRNKLILLVSLSCLLMGCAKEPEVISENGISYAVNEKNSAIEEIVNEKLEENENSEISEEPYDCVRSIGDGDNIIKIDAIVENVGKKNIELVTVSPYADMFNKEKITEIFFSGETNVKDITEQINQEEEQQTQDEGIEEVKMPATNRLCLQSEDEKLLFARKNDTSFYFSNSLLVGRYKENSMQGEENAIEHDLTGYTVDEAKKRVTEVLKNIGMEDVKIESCRTSYNQQGEGYYDIVFTPVVNELPLVLNEYDMNTDSVVDVYGRVQIGIDGIAETDASNCLWKVTERKKTECMNLEQALAVLEQYVINGEIHGVESITYSKCELAYLPTTKDWKTATLTPVWRFYVPAVEYESTDFDWNTVWENGVSLNICINAVTGEIEYMQ